MCQIVVRFGTIKNGDRAMLTFPKVLTDVRQVKAYVLAGNSTFTLKSKATENHFTFRVQKPKVEAGQPEPTVRFVQVMTGTDNESSFSYLGTIFTADNNYRHGRKSRINETATSAKAFSWFWSNVQVGNVPEKVEVMRSSNCCRCGKKLTNPLSIETGIGPECSGRIS